MTETDSHPLDERRLDVEQGPILGSELVNGDVASQLAAEGQTIMKLRDPVDQGTLAYVRTLSYIPTEWLAFISFTEVRRD